MMAKLHDMIVLIIHILILLSNVGSVRQMPKNKLNEFITHFEPLEYDREALLSNHIRIQTEYHTNTSQPPTIPFTFYSHHRYFDIRLSRDTSLFTHDLHVEDTADNFHPSNIYEGHIIDEPFSSSVHGFIYDGIFEGRIYTETGEEFHIESVKQYEHLDSTTIHSIIYNVKDIVHQEMYQCAGKKARPMHWYDNATEEKQLHWNDTIQTNHVMDLLDYEIPYIPNRDLHQRDRRHAGRYRRATDKKECHLFIRADPTYIEAAKGDTSRSLYMITQHVKKVAKFYRDTDFDQDGSKDGISLNIKRIGVIDVSKCKDSSTGDCVFKPRYIGVEKFLDLASLGNWDAYCLSYVFCHRDFNGGVLGLAWIGDPVGVGGICDKQLQLGGVMKSLNSGIVSNLNYGKNVPAKIVDVTLAHEIGHNFGSQHDPKTSQCSPGGSSGNYIMYPRATSGDDENSSKFSSCSIASMFAVIKARAPKCFRPPGEPICGNRMVEGKEDCDCGYDNEPGCQKDKCCVGASMSGSGGCRLTPKARRAKGIRCSPSTSVCCDPESCIPYKEEAGKVCAKSDDCSGEAICNSKSKDCPPPKAKPDKAKCNKGANVCEKGKCSGTLCSLLDKVSCQCNQTADFCHVCCQDKSKTEKCSVYLSSDDNKKKKRPPGSPCENYKGYCDILHKCRKVDAEGPFSRLKKFLVGPEAFNNMLTWMKSYWWACILVGLGLVALMAAFIYFCSVHTPSSNPHKKPPKKYGRGGGGNSQPAEPANDGFTLRENAAARGEQPSFGVR